MTVHPPLWFEESTQWEKGEESADIQFELENGIPFSLVGPGSLW